MGVYCRITLTRRDIIRDREGGGRLGHREGVMPMIAFAVEAIFTIWLSVYLIQAMVQALIR